MKIWLLRHGATVCSEQRRYQGRLDVPLSPQGFAALRRAGFDPGVVYVSPMLRARQTAAVLFPEAELVEFPDLREMDFGIFEGRNAQEMANDLDYRVWVESGCIDQTPGGVSWAGILRS